MPRSPRLDVLGVVHHVMARGIEKRVIFRGARDREEFLRRLGEVVVAGKAQLLSWALLPNHYHLVLRPQQMHLKDLMRRLMTGYAGWFNRVHRRHGHLFQNRYRSIVVEEEPHLLELVRYVSLNPLRAKLVSGIGELDAFPYTGHAVLMGRRTYEAQDTDSILGRFGKHVGEAREKYREFVAAGLAEGWREEFRGGGLVRSAGGWEALKRRSPEERERGDERVLGSGTFVEALLAEDRSAPCVAAKTVDEVLTEVSRAWKVSTSEILGPSRERRISRARAQFYVRAQNEAGQNLADLARMTGRTEPAVWQVVQRERAAMARARP
ncbi:MAG: transposase [Deltaproteobacteria bacterium]|nr:transposase [Deltaproteobacteria bacterium]